MIRINQIKVSLEQCTNEQIHMVADQGQFMQLLIKQCAKEFRIEPKEIDSITIVKQSIDARKKPDLFYVYTIDVCLKDQKQEDKVLKRCKNATRVEKHPYEFLVTGKEKLAHRVVVVGSGPAGLFCAYFLAKAGYCPIVLERGSCMEERVQAVEEFWKDHTKLLPNCNVQFGEGGAGTFSDGKLNTMVKDPYGRYEEMLRILVAHGGPKDLLYRNKPHIGTDLLRNVVTAMRKDIIANGGEYRFDTQMTKLEVVNGAIQRVELNHSEWLDTEAVVLAIGHSARDTFLMLSDQQVCMEAKPFAVGVRVMHPQNMINENQLGKEYPIDMPACDYKLTAQSERTNRGIYSFCMCPGGYVVNASSEPNRLAINGMSNHDRASQVANSALIVTVTPEDYEAYGRETTLPRELYGMAFQRALEARAYEAGEGKIPVQLYGDFCQNQLSTGFGAFLPQMKGAYTWANLRTVLPDVICESLMDGMASFDRKIHGFAREDCILAGVESRTSSPIRILRDEAYVSQSIQGLYPCGEGAGYAGGISSAAIDGMKVAEAIAKRYAPNKC